MKRGDIDSGNEFNFGNTSSDYSKYRDIYPDSMYQKLYDLGIGQKGQMILDLGTGTGVFPRAMYKYGAQFTGIDISREQIEYAIEISKNQNMNIRYKVCPAESTELNSGEYDIITSVQSFIYFDRERIGPELTRLLRNGGKMVIIWMVWLPYESKIAEATERLVLQYNPAWSGAGYRRSTDDNFLVFLPDIFEKTETLQYTENLEFNYETWTGRIRACRGVSASLPGNLVDEFNREHTRVLKEMTDEPFKIPHEIRIGIYKRRLQPVAV